ncbi:MAG: hypothetical protein J6P16_06830, partial [Eubacterium sp.]|nr:hypothetical protein [Eubacterium sp.]
MKKKSYFTKSAAVIFLSFTVVMGGITPSYTDSKAKNNKPAPGVKSVSVLTGTTDTVKIKNVTKKTVKKLSVKSSKKAVAKVSPAGNGKKTGIKITAIKPGASKITANIRLKNGKKYTFKISVKVADEITRKTRILDGATEKVTDHIKLKFYKETPNVPYIDIANYYRYMTNGKELGITVSGQGVYLLSSATGITGILDTERDEFSSDDYARFVETNIQSDVNSAYDGAPYLEPLPDTARKPAQKYSVSFSNYDIDVKGENENIFLPLQTAGVFFANFAGRCFFYDGTDIYLTKDLNKLRELVYSSYTTDLINSLKNGIPSDLSSFNYNNICFMMDNDYGNPGRSYISAGIADKGFDKTLSETDAATGRVKELLMSRDFSEFLGGMHVINNIFYDGGHTHLDLINEYLYPKSRKKMTAHYESLQEEFKALGYEMQPFGSITNSELKACSEARKKLGEGYYHTSGDTAVYSFDSFGFDVDAWNKYYKDGGEIPEDTFGTFMKSVNKAQADPNIKNFVLDLTCNSGGSTDVVSAMMGIMCDDPSFRTVKKTTKEIDEI